MADEQGQCWSAEQTAYLRSLDASDRNAWAVLYQKPPTKHENGTTSFSLNFPVLIVTAYSAEPEKVAGRVASILNKHWNDEGHDVTPATGDSHDGRR